MTYEEMKDAMIREPNRFRLGHDIMPAVLSPTEMLPPIVMKDAAIYRALIDGDTAKQAEVTIPQERKDFRLENPEVMTGKVEYVSVWLVWINPKNKKDFILTERRHD